jgi:Zn-dependent peptidase ImmA (M78 family)
VELVGKQNSKIMRIIDLLESKDSSLDFMSVLEAFLPFVKDELELEQLPKIKLKKEITDISQPTFGYYDTDTKTVYLGLSNRHPLDIIRTLAHELVHYRQDINNELTPDSGATGSPHENEAHHVAGAIMRNFNKANPEFFSISPVQLG